MQPMKRREFLGPALNLVARGLVYRVTNTPSDYRAGLSNENMEVGKSVLQYGAKSCGFSSFTANEGLEPLRGQFFPWSKAEKRSGSVGTTCPCSGAQTFSRERDMIYYFGLKDSYISTAKQAIGDDFAEKVCRSGSVGDNFRTADLRGGFKPFVGGLGFRVPVRGSHKEFNGGTYLVDEKVFVDSGFRRIGRGLHEEAKGRNHLVNERKFAGFGFRVRGLHTEIKGENRRVDKKLSEKVATVRKVRPSVRTKPALTTSRRRRMVGRLVPTTTIRRQGSVDVDVPSSVSITQREMELELQTESEGNMRPTGRSALVPLADHDHREETQNQLSGQIVPTNPRESTNVFQHVTVTENDEMSTRASAQAMALLRAALDEAEDDTEDVKVDEDLQRSLRVGIVGAPNAGKSLLTNQLVGTRVSAVSRKTNTTHREHLGVYTKADTQLLYYDTPGLHLDIEGSPLRVDAQHRVRNAWEIVDFCEALVVLVDAERQIRRPDKRVQRLVEKLGKQDENVSQKRVLCLNKVDIIEQKRTLLPLAKQFEDLLGYDRIFMISGLTGSGVNDVKDYLVSQAVLRPWDEDPDMKDTRDIALEIVREQVFEHLHEELPHTTKQKLVSWKVLKDGSIRIQQLLLVAKKEHQKILVGKNGAVIGEIGIKARKELTEILGATVHLVLDVKLMSPSMFGDQ